MKYSVLDMKSSHKFVSKTHKEHEETKKEI